jgi:chromosomal replication initiation ATPase DnaA
MFMGTALVRRGPLYHLYSQELTQKKLDRLKKEKEETRINLIRDQFVSKFVGSKDILPTTAIREGVVVPSLHTVLRSTANHFELNVDDLIGASRKAHHTYARHIYSYVSYMITQSSSVQIAKAIKRDHSTIFNSFHKVRSLFAEHPDTTKADVDAVIFLSAKASCIEPFYWGC